MSTKIAPTINPIIIYLFFLYLMASGNNSFIDNVIIIPATNSNTIESVKSLI